MNDVQTLYKNFRPLDVRIIPFIGPLISIYLFMLVWGGVGDKIFFTGCDYSLGYYGGAVYLKNEVQARGRPVALVNCGLFHLY